MASPVIQANYEALDTIALNFGSSAESTEQMLEVIRQYTAAVRDYGWIGLGADAFLQEMDYTVLPTLGRLTGALTEASRLTLQVAHELEQAEDEAAALFGGNGSGGAG